jgi:hypothetical protein
VVATHDPESQKVAALRNVCDAVTGLYITAVTCLKYIVSWDTNLIAAADDVV